jgi:hypothetical protein
MGCSGSQRGYFFMTEAKSALSSQNASQARTLAGEQSSSENCNQFSVLGSGI